MFENFIYRKNGFDAISKNLAIVQNNYVAWALRTVLTKILTF